MAEVVVRPYEDRDEVGYYTVSGLTYNNGDITPALNPSMDVERYVAEVEGQIAGTFVILPMTANRGTAILPMGGVAGVAVAPDCRRGGVGSAMMQWYVRHAAATGVPLASLYAFRETFYRRFGYEVVGKRVRIVAQAHRLPLTDADLPVRRLGWEDWPELAACYAAFARSRSGLNMRQQPWQWKRVLAENKPLTVYAFGDPVEAYVAVSHQTNFWVEQGLSEFVWSTRRGYLNALAFLRQLGMNKTSVAWFEPSDSPFYAQFLDQGVDARIERPVMFRVNNVEAALCALTCEGSGSFAVGISDSVVPENDGVWQVDWSDGAVNVEKGGEADFSLSIQAFAQALMGEPSLAELVRHELVNVHNPRRLEAAYRLLSPSATVCMDFF